MAYAIILDNDTLSAVVDTLVHHNAVLMARNGTTTTAFTADRELMKEVKRLDDSCTVIELTTHQMDLHTESGDRLSQAALLRIITGLTDKTTNTPLSVAIERLTTLPKHLTMVELIMRDGIRMRDGSVLRQISWTM